MGEGGNSPEILTADSRFEIVTDKVPLVSSWGLHEIKPRPGLVTAAVVQRFAQLHSSFFSIQPQRAGSSLVDVPLESLGIGLEDKLIRREPDEGMVKYFASEGTAIRQAMEMKFPGRAYILDSLIKNGQIQNSGSEYGDLQLLMLVELDRGVAGLVARLNKDLKKGDPAFDFRQKIYDFLKTSGMPEERLISYTNGERRLALPRGELLKLPSGAIDLEVGLRNLTYEERKDWEFLRSAVFMFDPRLREVFEANREIVSPDFRGKSVKVASEELGKEINRVARERLRRHPR